jgi:hypothetical protein
MKTPLSDRVTEAVKTFGAEVKEAVDSVGGRVEGAVDALGKEIDRLGRLIRQAAFATVRFEAQASTELGEAVLVVGNRVALGDWQPERGLALDGQSYPRWTGELQVEPRALVEYKYERAGRESCRSSRERSSSTSTSARTATARSRGKQSTATACCRLAASAARTP